MGNAAYNRGSKRISQGLQDDYAARKREERVIVKNYEDALRIVARENKDLKAQVERLQVELAESQEQMALKNATAAALQADLEAAQGDVSRARQARDTWKAAHDIHKEKHEICSQVIRLGMTPERYHELREIVRNG